MSTEDLPAAIEYAAPDWRPSTQVDVERALRGLERFAAEYAGVKQTARELRADIDDWEERHLSALSARATPIVNALEAWAREMRAVSDGRVKSWDFPSGRIETSKARSKTVIDDEAACIEWCDENLPDAVKREVTILVSVIAKACEVKNGKFLTPDGEVVPGVHQTILPDSAVKAEVKLSSHRLLPKAVHDES
jgi:hypothetical protein